VSNVYDAADRIKNVPEIIPEDTTTKKRLVHLFIAFLSGFAALLTPCVFL
jgi:cytochrome c biogenesis protein CcdA